jgi:hypothetical protein
MKHRHSPFTEDTCKLSIIDIVRLLVGKEIKSGALVIGLYKMPKNYAESLLP